ncbi:lipopolysaccharide ABC transporter permease LptF, partial [Vibrio cholerae]
NATGIGNKFLIRAALYLALITASVAAFNALWLAPWSQDKEAHLMEQFAAENITLGKIESLVLTAPQTRYTTYDFN